MLKRFLSQYHPQYIRSLVYMLQATEYKVGDYLAWFRRVENFRKVEVRGKLVKTPKATLLFLLMWLMALCLFLGVRRFTAGMLPTDRLLYAVLAILALPYFLAYGVIVLLLVGQIFIQKPLEWMLVNKARQALKKHKAFKIAIAGSYGKTSMREILRKVLSADKKVSAPPRSYNTPLALAKFVKGLKGDEEVLIFELGEYYPGDIKKLCRLVQPDMGVITGVNEAHLQKFKTLDKTVKTIFELANYLGDKPTYVNGESPLAKKNAWDKHILYTREGVGDWRVKNSSTGLEGTSFTLEKDGMKVSARSKLLGLHQIGPLSAAVDIGVRLGLSGKELEEGIQKTRAFEHRLEPKKDGTGAITLDDSYNGSPDGVKAVIEFLASLKVHRRFYVTPGLVEMGKRTEEVHKEIGRELTRAKIEKVVLIRNSATPYIEEGLKEAGYSGEVIWFEDSLAAFSALPNLTVEGDVVLLQNDWPDQYY